MIAVKMRSSLTESHLAIVAFLGKKVSTSKKDDLRQRKEAGRLPIGVGKAKIAPNYLARKIGANQTSSCGKHPRGVINPSFYMRAILFIYSSK